MIVLMGKMLANTMFKNRNNLLSNLMHSMCQILNIFRSYTGHWNAAVFGKVNAEFLGQPLHLKFSGHLYVNLQIIYSLILTWSAFIPVKQNIPIWLVIWSQLFDEPSFWRFSFNLVLTEMILSAIPLTCCNLKSKICGTIKLKYCYKKFYAQKIHAPFFSELCVTKNLGNNSSTINRGIWIHGSD